MSLLQEKSCLWTIASETWKDFLGGLIGTYQSLECSSLLNQQFFLEMYAKEIELLRMVRARFHREATVASDADLDWPTVCIQSPKPPLSSSVKWVPERIW